VRYESSLEFGKLRQIDVRGSHASAFASECLGRRAPDPLRRGGDYNLLAL